MEYAAVVEALLSGGDNRIARVRQVSLAEIGVHPRYCLSFR